MALSYQAETSDGTLKRVVLGIDFFDTEDIYVTQGDRPLSTPADYQWDGRTAINLTEVVPAGVLLMVRRKTDNTVTRLKFSQGAPFVRENIDSQNKQFLFLAQEASEGAFGDLYNNLNMHNFRIFNLAEPTDDGDAATKGWAVRTFSGIYSEYLALCKAEADRAVIAANHAVESERMAKDAASTSTANAIQTGQDAVVANSAKDVAERKAVEAATSAAASEASAVRAENAADAVTGAILDGGACDLSSGVYPPPLEVKGTVYSTVWAVTVGGTIDGIVYVAGDGLRYTINGNYYFRVDIAGEVKAQIRAHAEKPDAHPMTGVAGLNAALEDKASVAELNSAITAHETKHGAHTPENVGAASGVSWVSKVMIGQWSALCRLKMDVLTNKSLITIGNTRATLVVNVVVLASTGHSAVSSITQLESHNYGQIKLRLSKVGFTDEYDLEVLDENGGSGLTDYSLKCVNLFGTIEPFYEHKAGAASVGQVVTYTEWQTIKINNKKVFNQGFLPTPQEIGAEPAGVFVSGEPRTFASRKQLDKRADEYHPLDGQLVPRSTDAGLLAAIIAGEVPSCTDADWLANKSNRGMYTLGDGSTTIRLPDWNGKSEGAEGAIVIRGDGANSEAEGIIQGDAIRNITGTVDPVISGIAWLPIERAEGAFKVTTEVSNTFTPNPNTYSLRRGGAGITFDASGVVPTALENRMVNTAGVHAVKR